MRHYSVEGTRPRLQPTARQGNGGGAGGSLDPATSLARLRQLGLEQRVEAVRSVIRGVVADLTDAEVAGPDRTSQFSRVPKWRLPIDGRIAMLYHYMANLTVYLLKV